LTSSGDTRRTVAIWGTQRLIVQSCTPIPMECNQNRASALAARLSQSDRRWVPGAVISGRSCWRSACLGAEAAGCRRGRAPTARKLRKSNQPEVSMAYRSRQSRFSRAAWHEALRFAALARHFRQAPGGKLHVSQGPRLRHTRPPLSFACPAWRVNQWPIRHVKHVFTPSLSAS
jgi:hypothetical protein